MKKLITLSVLASALMTPVLASAATAELKLIGTITPAACVPNFTGGSTIDYGNIAAGTLNASAQTMLPEKNTSFTVTCDAPIKFGFSVVDERSASAVTTLDTISGYEADHKFGLGTAAGGAKIGVYSLQITKSVPNAGTANYKISQDSGATWANSSGGIRNSSSTLMAWGSDGTLVPAAYTSMATDIRVVAAIDKSSNLPITDEIKIDGLSTFEVKYL